MHYILFLDNFHFQTIREAEKGDRVFIIVIHYHQASLFSTLLFSNLLLINSPLLAYLSIINRITESNAFEYIMSNSFC